MWAVASVAALAVIAGSIAYGSFGGAAIPGQNIWAVFGINLGASTNAARIIVEAPSGTQFTQKWLDARSVSGVTGTGSTFTVTCDAAMTNLTPTFALAEAATTDTPLACTVSSLTSSQVVFKAYFALTNGTVAVGTVNGGPSRTNTYYVQIGY